MAPGGCFEYASWADQVRSSGTENLRRTEYKVWGNVGRTRKEGDPPKSFVVDAARGGSERHIDVVATRLSCAMVRRVAVMAPTWWGGIELFCRWWFWLAEFETAAAPPSELPDRDIDLRRKASAFSSDGVFMNTSVQCALAFSEKETASVVLNCSADLVLGTASLYSEALKSEKLIDQSAQVVDKDLGRVTFNFLKALPAGSEARLKIEFNAMLRGSMNGYYKSAWEKDGKGALTSPNTLHISADRSAYRFPCWDESLLKATFGFTMISRVDTINTLFPLRAELRHAIEREDGSSQNLQIRVDNFRLATPDLIHQAEFALEVAARVLPLYDHIQHRVPASKTGYIGGAMENRGLTTGRVAALLLDPKKADIHTRKEWRKHRIMRSLICGFTTLMGECIVLNKQVHLLLPESNAPSLVCFRIFPEWGVTSSFVSNRLLSALTVDAKRWSHPIEVDCPDANFINQIFDKLSYAKATASHAFRICRRRAILERVSIYLKKKVYGNSVTNDLWDGISTATGLDVHGVMYNWIGKIGFPLITVTETPSPSEVHIRQDKFLDNGHLSTEENQTIGKIPLGILTVDQSCTAHVDKTAILEEREKTILLDTSRSFKLNSGTVGVYRALYTPTRLSEIASDAARDESVFSKDNRIGLISDSATLIFQSSVIQELRNRFNHFSKTGDDSMIPPDLQQKVFIAAVKFGSQVEFDKMLTIIQNSPTRSARVTAMCVPF
ncbi:hypothetical protein C8J57DRAFT_1223380 [Mycena rebaudengoi]|nr:hypothetical protein C8J57DRAFT_1223380 [Mycena rebaudengoi]